MLKLGILAMESAVDRARDAVKTLTALHGPEHADVFAAHVRFFKAAAEAGMRHTLVDPSEHLFQQARQAMGPEHPLTLTLGFEHAEALGAVSRDLESLEVHRRIHGLRVQVLGPDHEDSLDSLNSIAVRCRSLSDGPAALTLYTRLFDARCRLNGPDSKEALLASNGVGMALALLARNMEAVELYEQLLPAAERAFDATSSDLWSFRNNYANALGGLGRLAESAALHRRVYAERLRSGGPAQALTLQSACNLCTQLRELGEWGTATDILSGAIDGATEKLRDRHPQIIQARMDLAGLLWGSGEHRESMALHLKVAEDCVGEFGFAHPTTLFCHESLAERLVETGDVPAATAMRRRIHTAALEAFGPDHLMRFWAHQILASGLSWAKEHHEALEHARLAAEGRRRLLGTDHQGTLDSDTLVAHTLVWLKRHGEAAVKYSDLADQWARRNGEADPTALRHRWNAARQLFRAGEHERALPALKATLQAQIAAHGEGDGESLQMLYRYSHNLYAAGDWESALEHLSCWAQRVESVFGPSAPETIKAITRLAERCEDLEVPGAALLARRRLVDAWGQATGKDSDETVDAETSLIATCMEFDDAEAAIEAARDFAQARRQRLGGSHEQARASDAALAHLLELQGEWDALIALRREALDYAMTASSDSRLRQEHQYALAEALAAAGQDKEAFAQLRVLVPAWTTALGARHDLTVRALHVLAHLCARSETPGDAIGHYEALVKTAQAADGSDTRESLAARMAWAHLLDELGKDTEAADAFRMNYALAENLAGDDAMVLTARNSLARRLHEDGHVDEAFGLFRWNVIESVRILGPDHVDSIALRCSLATALMVEGHAGEAAELLEAAVDDHVEGGGGLAMVLPILQALADALRQSGRQTEVASAYRRVIAALGRHYPLPDDLTDNELREILPDPFRYEDAIELQRLNLEEVHSAFGHRHETTRQAIQQLLNTLQATLTALGKD